MVSHFRCSFIALIAFLGMATGLRIPASTGRRNCVALAAAAVLAPPKPSHATPPTFVAGKQRQGLGQFIKGFNNAVVAGDVSAVQDALKLFDLIVDEETARVAIESSKLPVSKIASGNLPVIVETTSGLLSAKPHGSRFVQ